MPEVLIVRMPDNTGHTGGRYWLEKKEVDEMMVREQSERQENWNVKVTQWDAPKTDQQLSEGMNLRFVGHGNRQGFIANGGFIDAQRLTTWIRDRRPDNKIITLSKIKLQTCNAGNGDGTGSEEQSFVRDLANRLRGVVKGKVIGYTSYILSVPQVKVMYRRESTDANRLGNSLEKQHKQKTEELKSVVIDIIWPDNVDELENQAKLWATTVINFKNGKNPREFEESLGKNATNKKECKIFLGGSKAGLAWWNTKNQESIVWARELLMKSEASNIAHDIKDRARVKLSHWIETYENLINDVWSERRVQILTLHDLIVKDKEEEKGTREIVQEQEKERQWTVKLVANIPE